MKENNTLLKLIVVLSFIGLVTYFGCVFVVFAKNGFINNPFKYEEGLNFCNNKFLEKYGKYPFDSTVNVFGECIYKLDSMQNDYIPYSELKK